MATVEVLDTDITALEVDAIANAANTRLLHGGGVAGAISRAGGPAVDAESAEKAPIGLGEAVETTAGDMPARWVIHAATMELGGPTSDDIVRRATASTLARADELGARSLALVAFGTGVGGFPLDDAARIEVEEVRRHLDAGSQLERVVFAVHGDAARRGVRGRTGLSVDELLALGGASAPPAATARMRALLQSALRHGREELDKPRSGYREPVVVAFAAAPETLMAATPAVAGFRADPDAVSERGWLLVAAAVAVLVELAAPGPPAGPGDLQAGDLDGFLVARPAGGRRARRRRRVRAAAVRRARRPARPPPGPRGAPCRRGCSRAPSCASRSAPTIRCGWPRRSRASAGARRTRARSRSTRTRCSRSPLRSQAARAVRPHEDPDPARRVARRILQRLDGMGKWGGYHTDFAHLARGFAGNERKLAQAVGEALLEAGLLAEKPSVGQRHVFLNPRRAAEIRRLIDEGALPPGMRLPSV